VLVDVRYALHCRTVRLVYYRHYRTRCLVTQRIHYYPYITTIGVDAFYDTGQLYHHTGYYLAFGRCTCNVTFQPNLLPAFRLFITGTFTVGLRFCALVLFTCDSAIRYGLRTLLAVENSVLARYLRPGADYRLALCVERTLLPFVRYCTFLCYGPSITAFPLPLEPFVLLGLAACTCNRCAHCYLTF